MPDTLFSLILFALVATITPGGATTLATASGAQFGLVRSLPLLGGIAAGLATLAAASAAGLATLLLATPALQTAMKLAGSVYLLWLAWRIARSGPPPARTGDTAAAAQPIRFFNGILLLWLNPKGWAMTLGAAASFAALSPDPVRLALVLGAAFGLCAAFSLTLWCLGGLLLARILKTERQWRAVNLLLGLLLAASTVQVWM